MDQLKKPNVCSVCKQTFKRFADLRKHVKKFHLQELDKIAPLPIKSYPFQCQYCRKNFSEERNLTMHLKTHKESKYINNSNLSLNRHI